MKAVLALVLVLALVVGSPMRIVAGAGDPAFATLDQGTAWYVYGATMAELLRKTLPPGSNIDVKPLSGGVGNPRLVAKNETPLGLSFTVTNRWAIEGKEAYDREARQPARPGRRARHLLPRRDRHQEARDHLGRATSTRQEAPAEALHAAGRLAGRVRGAPAPAREYGSATTTSRASAAPPSTWATTIIVDAFKDGRADLLIAVVTPKHPSISEIVTFSETSSSSGLEAETAQGAGCRWATPRPPCRPRPSRARRSRSSTVGFPTVLITNKDAARADRLHDDQDRGREQGRAGARPRRAGRVRPDDGVAAREGRHAPASGRRAGVPREGVDEIAADWVFDQRPDPHARPARGRSRGALAVQGGRVVAVGGRRDVRGWRDRRTRVIDLRGATVIPGLVDAHAHLDREGLKLIYPSLARCRSIADVQSSIRRLAAGRKPGEWIVTMPLGAPPFYQDAPSGLAEGRWPTRADLDVAAPGPSRVHARHLGLLEQAARLLRRQQPCAAARRHHARHGAASSGVEILQGRGRRADRRLRRAQPHPGARVHADAGRRRASRTPSAWRALVESQRRYAARGVTAVYEGHGIAPEVLAVYRESHERGDAAPALLAGGQPDVGGPAEAARAMRGAGGRGRVGAGSATIACAWAASACTTAATPRSRASCTTPSPTRGGRASWRAPTTPTRTRAGRAGRAARAARQHAGHALPARGPRRLGGGRRAASHSRSALGARASERAPRPSSSRASAGSARSPRPTRSRISGARPATRWRGSAALPTSCCPTGAWHASASPSASPPTTSRPIRGSPSWPSWPAATCARARSLGPARAPDPGPGARRAHGGWRLGDVHTSASAGVLAPGATADLAVLEHDPLTAPLEDLSAMTGAAHHGRRRDRRTERLPLTTRACLGPARVAGHGLVGSSSCTPPTRGMFDLLIQLPVHVAFAVALGFLPSRPRVGRAGGKARRRRPRLARRRPRAAGLLCAAHYVWTTPPGLAHGHGGRSRSAWTWSSASSSPPLLLEAARRHTGAALVILALVFVAYAFVGPWLPGFLGPRRRHGLKLVDQQMLTTEGIFGIPTLVSATFIYLFVRLRRRHAPRRPAAASSPTWPLAVAGASRGGAGKVAVISSGLFGMVNGSAIANAVTTGAFTIPLMITRRLPARVRGGGGGVPPPWAVSSSRR